MVSVAHLEPGMALRLHTLLSVSRVGQRWERLARRHAGEVEALLAVHPDVQEHTVDALVVLAGAAGAAPLDDPQLAVLGRLLDDIARLGGVELRQAALALRDELELARGRTLEEVLGGG